MTWNNAFKKDKIFNSTNNSYHIYSKPKSVKLMLIIKSTSKLIFLPVWAENCLRYPNLPRQWPPVSHPKVGWLFEPLKSCSTTMPILGPDSIPIPIGPFCLKEPAVMIKISRLVWDFGWFYHRKPSSPSEICHRCQRKGLLLGICSRVLIAQTSVGLLAPWTLPSTPNALQIAVLADQKAALTWQLWSMQKCSTVAALHLAQHSCRLRRREAIGWALHDMTAGHAIEPTGKHGSRDITPLRLIFWWRFHRVVGGRWHVDCIPDEFRAHLFDLVLGCGAVPRTTAARYLAAWPCSCWRIWVVGEGMAWDWACQAHAPPESSISCSLSTRRDHYGHRRSRRRSPSSHFFR